MLSPQTTPTPRPDSIVQLLRPNGTVDVASLVVRFRTTKGHLAELVGVSPDSLYKTGRSASPKTQARLREMLEILVRISGWAGGLEQALAWYKAQPIPAFGDRTAESLVKDGYAGALRDYFDGLALGGFA